MLQWARANGCPWDDDTCMHAAEGGHLALLAWLRAQGCPESSGHSEDNAEDASAFTYDVSD